MYLSCKLYVDPSQLTYIKRVKPREGFRKLFYYLSLGSLAPREERETFTALSILQQTTDAFKSIQVDNIVRLAQDDETIYTDEKGRENDLQDALQEYKGVADENKDRFFQQLSVVLEHEDAHFHYIIEMSINRTHKVGAYPIEIYIDGLFKDFHKKADMDALQASMQPLFKDEDAYEDFLKGKQHHFERFVQQITEALSEQMAIDDTKKDFYQQLIAPETKINENTRIKKRKYKAKEHYPAFEDYEYMDDYRFYCFLWSNLLFDSDLAVEEDTGIFTTSGELLGTIDDTTAAYKLPILSENESYEDSMKNSSNYMDIEHEAYSQDDDTKWFDWDWDLDSSFDFGGDSSFDAGSDSFD